MTSRRIHFLLTIACAYLLATPGHSAGQALSWDASFEERLDFRCPDRHAALPIAAPELVVPSSEAPFEVTYSSKNEIVRHVGMETERSVSLGSGSDIALLYDIGAGGHVRTDGGPDTVLVCSMLDNVLWVEFGTNNQNDDDRDILILEPAIFKSIPDRFRRVISVMWFDPERDALVIHAPQDLIAARVDHTGSIQIGNVLLHFVSLPGASPPGIDSKALHFIPE